VSKVKLGIKTSLSYINDSAPLQMLIKLNPIQSILAHSYSETMIKLY